MYSDELVIAITDVTRNADIIGKAFLVPDLFNSKVLISCDVASVLCHGMDKYFLEMLFNSKYYHDYIKHFASGTLVLHLDLNGINWFKTFIPPTPLMDKFSAIAEKLYRKKIMNIEENKNLAELRDWLLPMLMNGQVTVV